MCADRELMLRAFVAQLVEQLICNQQVAGSNPVKGSSPRGGFDYIRENLTSFSNVSKHDNDGDATWILQTLHRTEASSVAVNQSR